MTETAVELDQIAKVYGDRVLVRRFEEPEKKRGFLVPVAYAKKKDSRKVWWAEIEQFGHESKAEKDYDLKETLWVGVEPLGHHYATFKGDDGHDYVWVPDEHLCLADLGSVSDYYSDRLDKQGPPRLRILGNRLLVRPIEEKPSKILKPHNFKGDREARLGEVVALGDVEEDWGIKMGDRIVHVADDSGASCEVDLFDPPLTILRASDIIALLAREDVP